MNPPKPITTRGVGGEYSTVLLPDGTVETVWFGDDGSHRFVKRTVLPSVADIAKQHIADDKV